MREFGSEEIPQVGDGHDGIVPEHAGAGIAHYLSDALAHDGLVAMQGASGATGFGIAIAAMLQASMGVSFQFSTLGAKNGRGRGVLLSLAI